MVTTCGKRQIPEHTTKRMAICHLLFSVPHMRDSKGGKQPKPARVTREETTKRRDILNNFKKPAQNSGMSKKRKKNADLRGDEALRAGLISANEYTGYVQHIPVTNEDIELYKRMYGGGTFSPDDIGG